MIMNKVVTGDTYRFTVITDSLIRLEEDPAGKFEDRPSQTVVNRDFDEPKVKVISDNNGHKLEIITDSFHLYYDGGKFTPESLYIDAAKAHALYQNRWYFGTNNDERHQNLKGTTRTLDHADGQVPLEDGIMSKDGYSYLDDSKSFIYIKDTDSYVPRANKVTDGYFFCYGRDYQATLSDFYKLTGPTPMIPRFALGNWWSRFYPYTQDEYKKLMQRFDNKKIPISVSIIDTDWHRHDIPQKYGSSWTGYSWNKALFPDHEKLLKWLHDDGKKVSLNVHPASGIRAFEDDYKAVAKTMGLNTTAEEPASFDLENPKFKKAYFKDVHHKMEDEGVDFWWIDWQQGVARTADKMDPLWLLNHYHYNDNNKRNNGNGIILSRYAGPGSHRYPLGFSGDTVISWRSLDFQPYFTSTAANIGYTWWSHDIGGHMRGNFDAELATRWVQFGVFSPINRLHSSNNLFAGKEPWNYREDFEKSQEKFLRLRSELLPYIDTANYQTHINGVPINKPVYYNYPNDKNAYAHKNEYYFGSEMLVSPITSPHDEATQTAFSDTWLPEGNWVDYFSHLPYDGGSVVKTYRDSDQMPVFVKKGSLIITNRDYMSNGKLPVNISVEVFSGVDGKFQMIEHVGEKIAKTTFYWDDHKQVLTFNTDDPDKIIPQGRKVDQVIYEYNKEDVFAEMRARLQRAYMSLDLKQKLFNAFNSENYNYAHFMNLLNTLEDKNIRGSLSEVAYIRESYI